MDKHIEVVGVDHGWSGMKTVSQVFTTGVKEITTEPAFYNNVVEFNGSYYKVGGKRLEVRDLNKIPPADMYLEALENTEEQRKDVNKAGIKQTVSTWNILRKRVRQSVYELEYLPMYKQ